MMNKYRASKMASVSESSDTKDAISSLFTTLLGSVLTTVALVGIHHYYRKQQQPEAHLSDYLTGLKTQLHSVSALSTPSLKSISRLNYSYQQAKHAWQHSTQQDLNKNQSLQDSSHTNNKTDFSALHTTIIVPRSVSWVSGVSSMPKPIDSATSTEIGSEAHCFGVVGIDADRQIVWQTTMPERVHDIVVQPKLANLESGLATSYLADNARHVIIMGRRPSDKFWILDTATGQVQLAIKAATDRHFYGHACYSLDGTKLYITENDTVSLEGKIGVYDAINGYQKVAEFDSHGIGPHELIMHPDSTTLVIANGGIKTEQASREELNLDTMRPSLVYLDRHNGELLEQIIPEHNQMSIRHLAMHDDGTVMIGIQFQGEKHLNVPLVLTHKRGDAQLTPLIMPNNQWQRFHHYIASVAVDSERNLLCVTTPIGGCAAIYDLSTYQLIDSACFLDCAGASIAVRQIKKGEIGFDGKSDNSLNQDSIFIVSDGQGQLTTLYLDKQNRQIIKHSQAHKMAFDNHLQALL